MKFKNIRKLKPSKKEVQFPVCKYIRILDVKKMSKMW